MKYRALLMALTVLLVTVCSSCSLRTITVGTGRVRTLYLGDTVDADAETDIRIAADAWCRIDARWCIDITRDSGHQTVHVHTIQEWIERWPEKEGSCGQVRWDRYRQFTGMHVREDCVKPNIYAHEIGHLLHAPLVGHIDDPFALMYNRAGKCIKQVDVDFVCESWDDCSHTLAGSICLDSIDSVVEEGE